MKFTCPSPVDAAQVKEEQPAMAAMAVLNTIFFIIHPV
ncbi:hypothetical protein BN135_3761 [Cronobacter muytjensii 530]